MATAAALANVAPETVAVATGGAALLLALAVDVAALTSAEMAGAADLKGVTKRDALAKVRGKSSCRPHQCDRAAPFLGSCNPSSWPHLYP